MCFNYNKICMKYGLILKYIGFICREDKLLQKNNEEQELYEEVFNKSLTCLLEMICC